MRAAVILTNTWPDPGGGGRGVTYRILEQLSEEFPHIDDCKLFGLFGERLVSLAGTADARRAMAQPMRSIFSRPPRVLTRPAKWLFQSQVIRRLAQRHECVVVIAQEPFFAVRLALHKRVFIVQVEHSKGGMHTEYLALHGSEDLRYRTTKALVHGSVERADWVVFPSLGAATLYEQSNPTLKIAEKIKIVYNGVKDPLSAKTASTAGGPAQELIVCNVANHVPEKAIDFTIEGIALWQSRSSSGRPIRLVNCGGFSAETKRLRELASKTGVNAEFLGTVPRATVLEMIAKADVFALTPSVAVFDLALLEAMALNRPIISTPVGGNREALGVAYRGYAKDPQEFAQKLDLVLKDKEFAAELQTQNRERFVRKFRSESMTHSYLDMVRNAFSVLESRIADRPKRA